MAFCKQCGTDLQGANFCPICGTSAAANVAQQQLDPRQQTLIEMNRMKEYFGAKEDLYRQYDAAAAEVAERTQRGFGGWIVAAVISLIIGLFSKAVFFYIAIAPCVAAFILFKKKNKEKLAQATTVCDELGKEKEKLYADYGYCSVGLEYTHPDILPILYGFVSDGEASTASEAIQRYKAALAEAERINKINEIGESIKGVEKDIKKTKGYAAASFWLKK